MKAEAEYNGKKGIWRTVSGRKIFIAQGESLRDAMKNSGKFGSSFGKNKKHYTDDMLNERKKLNDEWEKAYWKGEDAADKRISARSEKSKQEAFKKFDKSVNDRYKLDKKINDIDIKAIARKQKDKLDKLKEKDLSKIVSDYQNGAISKEEAINRAGGNEKELYKQFEKMGYKAPTKENIDKANDRARKNAIAREEQGNTMTTWDADTANESKIERLKTNDVKQKLAKQQAKKLTPAQLRKQHEQALKNLPEGSSNRKPISDYIQDHILSYYEKPQDFVDQMDNMNWLPTNWHRGQELAKGGSYLVYNGDVQDFMKKLHINPKGKEYDDYDAFQMYTSLIGRESERLYNKLKKRK